MLNNEFTSGNIDITKFNEQVYGENSSKLIALANTLNKFSNEKLKFETTINSLTTNTYTDKASLSSKDSISENINNLEEHKKIINNYQNIYFNCSEELMTHVRGMDISNAYKNSLEDSFYRSFKNNEARMKEYFNNGVKYCDCYIDLLKFLRDSFGNFEVNEDNTCAFHEQRDIDIFNEKINTINEIVQKQIDWKKYNDKLRKEFK